MKRALGQAAGAEEIRKMGETAEAVHSIASVPAHVPENLVIEADFYSDPLYATDPFAAIAWQSTGPRIFYTPTHYALPGCWVLTRAEDIRYVLQTPDLFSSRGGVGFAAMIGEAWDLIPLELDGPMHGAFRSLLNPLFSPKEVGKMEALVRSACAAILDGIAESADIEFISTFAQPFPVSVFLRLLDLPLEHMSMFLAWESGLLKSFRLEDRQAAARNIVQYMRQTIERRRGERGTDLVSFATFAEIGGRKLSDDEIVGICFLLFIAGLDTVASSLGFHYHHLAVDQALQAKLRADRSLIPTAVEEMMRLYSIVSNHRRVTQDCTVAGVNMRQGDFIMVPTVNASRDPREFTDPSEFSLERGDNRHVAFSYGPHRCLGSHLARRELVVAMNEIFDRLPAFSMKQGAPYRTVGGVVFGVEELHLQFDRT
jgi:cytochrome P450